MNKYKFHMLNVQLVILVDLYLYLYYIYIYIYNFHIKMIFFQNLSSII